MGKSVKLTDGSYIDAEGVYDATQGMTQNTINANLVAKANKFVPFALAAVRFGTFVASDSSKVQIVFDLSDGSGNSYGLDFYWTIKRISLWFYDASANTYKVIWTFT